MWLDSPPRPNVVPGTGSQQERIEHAIERLAGAIGDDTAFLWTGGKEAQVIADLLLYAVGDTQGQTPVPFVLIDTGNHFDEMYEFRNDYIAPNGDNGVETTGPPDGVEDVRVERYDELLNRVIDNDDDPRGYHGQWDEDVDLPDDPVIEGLPRSPDEWTVATSCGTLKTVPMRELIDEGYDTLITGQRSSDPISPGADGELAIEIEQSTPAPHTRVNPLADWSEQNIYAYIKHETVSLCSLYTDDGYRHTDSVCCTDDGDVGEYGEGGRDPQKRQAQDALEEMGYV